MKNPKTQLADGGASQSSQTNTERPAKSDLTIAIVGRPNVGKSTIFNRLTRRWGSIVEDRPGITRDRLYGLCEIEGHHLNIIDTGGLQISPDTKLEKKMSAQAFKGIEEADLVLFVLDGRTGVTPQDSEWVQRARKFKQPKLFVINKLDVPKLDDKLQDFYEMGLTPAVAISAEHQRNFSGLYEGILKGLNLKPVVYAPKPEFEEEPVEDLTAKKDFAIAIIGRPNVGKSTLLNAFLGEERCIVDDVPGTTRDSIHTQMNFNGRSYRIVDTAGIRKRAKTVERIEKFSVVKSLQEIDAAELVLLLIDSTVGPTEQDAHVAGYAYEKGKAMIIIANKWDVGSKEVTREDFEEKLELKMNYLQNYPVLYVSAKTGKNVTKIFEAIEFIREQYDKEIKTGELNRAFEYIVEHHPLPVYKGHSIKMYYATQVSNRPPTFVIFCNYPTHVHFTYKRYVTNALREMFKLENIPVRVVFKQR